jgi:hypothetical protein
MGYIRSSLIIGISIIVAVLVAAVYMQNTTRFDITPSDHNTVFLFDKKTTLMYACNDQRCRIISNYPLDQMQSQGFPSQGAAVAPMFLPAPDGGGGQTTLMPYTQQWPQTYLPAGLPGSQMPLHPFLMAHPAEKVPYKRGHMTSHGASHTSSHSKENMTSGNLRENPSIQTQQAGEGAMMRTPGVSPRVSYGTTNQSSALLPANSSARSMTTSPSPSLREQNTRNVMRNNTQSQNQQSYGEEGSYADEEEYE